MTNLNPYTLTEQMDILVACHKSVIKNLWLWTVILAFLEQYWQYVHCSGHSKWVYKLSNNAACHIVSTSQHLLPHCLKFACLISALLCPVALFVAATHCCIVSICAMALFVAATHCCIVSICAVALFVAATHCCIVSICPVALFVAATHCCQYF